jgi:hypothetical protein
VRPGALPHDNESQTAVECIREMYEWAERRAQQMFEASDNAKGHTCRTCKRTGLHEAVEMNYRIYQAQADVLKLVLTELEDYCIANY